MVIDALAWRRRNQTGLAMGADLSIAVFVERGIEELEALLPCIEDLASDTRCDLEKIIYIESTDDRAIVLADKVGAAVVSDGGLAAVAEFASADFIMTVDASCVQAASHIGPLWVQRNLADVLVASRRAPGNSTSAQFSRYSLNALVDRAVARMLSLDIRDVFSPFRLYRQAVLRDIGSKGREHLNNPLGILVHAVVEGWYVREVPVAHWLAPSHELGEPGRKPHRTSAILNRELRNMWMLRNSIESADYDMRAFNSRIPMQRWWQRRRHAITFSMVREFVGSEKSILNVGCGSSYMMLDLPGAIGVDIAHRKLRYMRRYRANRLVNASVLALPFRDSEFDCVICAEVIEHVPAEPSPLKELLRVLHPTGRLVLSTPDYATLFWPVIEWAYGKLHPHGYADEHITHYTRESLVNQLGDLGWQCVDYDYVCGSVLVAALEKRDLRPGPTSSMAPLATSLPII